MSTFNSADIAAFKDVWVFCEQRGGKLMPTDFELISEGRRLANELGVNLCGLLLGGEGIESALRRSWAATAPTRSYVCEHPLLSVYNTDAYAKVICDVIEELKPEAFLIGATNIGRDLGPRCAARLHTGLCADCTHLDVDMGIYQDFLREASTLSGGEDRRHQHRHGAGREARRLPRPEDDPSRLRRPPDGHHHLPPVPSLHGHGPSGRHEEEPLRSGQGRRLRDRQARLHPDREPTWTPRSPRWSRPARSWWT